MHARNQNITDALPRPTKCNACGGQDVSLENNRIIYGKSYGDWPLVWYCGQCEAAVGCHPNTDIPLGFMATAPTRRMRSQVHKAFDPIWRGGQRAMSRTRAYEWLARTMGIPVTDCHVSRFDADMCAKALAALESSQDELETIRKGHKSCR